MSKNEYCYITKDIADVSVVVFAYIIHLLFIPCSCCSKSWSFSSLLCQIPFKIIIPSYELNNGNQKHCRRNWVPILLTAMLWWRIMLAPGSIWRSNHLDPSHFGDQSFWRKSILAHFLEKFTSASAIFAL